MELEFVFLVGFSALAGPSSLFPPHSPTLPNPPHYFFLLLPLLPTQPPPHFLLLLSLCVPSFEQDKQRPLWGNFLMSLVLDKGGNYNMLSKTPEIVHSFLALVVTSFVW